MSDPGQGHRGSEATENRPAPSGGTESIGRRRRLTAGQTFIVVVVALLLASLLASGDLVDSGERLPEGVWRTVVLGIGHPLARASALLSLDRPLAFIQSLRSESATGASRGDDLEIPTGETATTGPVATQPAVPGAGPPASGPSSTSTSLAPALITPTLKEPLRVWVAGDSMVQQVGESLINMSSTIKTMTVRLQCKINSGLCRPDYYDWPKAARAFVSDYHPQASVVMFGGNDMQDLVEEGKVLTAWSPEWTEAYGRRVAEMIELLSADGGRVYWVGAPTMRAKQDARWARDLDRIYEKVCARYPQVTYIDGWKLFADKDGGYSAYLEDASGRSRLVREADGIHFTVHGGDRAVAALLKEMRTRWVLKAQ
jgi:uncharacterized protein